MTRAAALLVALAACRDAAPPPAPPPEPAPWSDAWLEREADRYLGPTVHRRAALEASLVNPTNIYSRQRLASYGKDTVGWDALPVWTRRSTWRRRWVQDPWVNDFERDGYTVVRGVVPPADIAVFAEVFTTIVPEMPYPPGPDGVIREVTGMAHGYEPMRRIAIDRRFGALVARALGAARVQLLQDSLLYKPAHTGGSVDWHQDRTYIGYLEPAQVATLRIALLPEDEANGCMRVVPGSHRWGHIGVDQSLTATSVASLLPQLTDEQRACVADARSLPLEPGDISIHHCLTLHGSPPNHSDRPRRTILIRMFDAACTLIPAKLPPGAEAFFATDASGHLAEASFPLVHD